MKARSNVKAEFTSLLNVTITNRVTQYLVCNHITYSNYNAKTYVNIESV